MPKGVKVETPEQTEIVVKGIDKQQVGQVAAEIRALPSARAVQGQGRALRRRAGKDQGDEEEVRRPRNRIDEQERARVRRARKTRLRIADAAGDSAGRQPFELPHYAQIIAPTGDKVLASASTLEADVRKDMKNGGNKAAAAMVGKRIAERAKALGIESVAFDRSGLPLPRPRAGAGRSGARRRPEVLRRQSTHGTQRARRAGSSSRTSAATACARR